MSESVLNFPHPHIRTGVNQKTISDVAERALARQKKKKALGSYLGSGKFGILQFAVFYKYSVHFPWHPRTPYEITNKLLYSSYGLWYLMVSLGITLIYPMAGTPEYGALGGVSAESVLRAYYERVEFSCQG